ncbi:phage antirepressor KilAC domain-containing protein [Piscirickettsia salmonis]|uniref:phage antirepressor KilAC domain-containing protein n=1 Tax=Piscirickettsia salmonis TaxID=1238 RepID=UPI0007C95C9F|nr:Phage antirepressor protein KilAC domain protein [Piscirickettsiaceae bacterium NZ-RLO1]
MYSMINNELKMSSREIAKLCGKHHKHVIKDVEKMLDELNLDRTKFRLIYLDSQNRKQKHYELDKNLTLVLVSGYSTKLRQKIISRWMELEASQSLDISKLSRVDILKMALEAEEEKQRLHSEVKEMQPKVEAFARISESTGSLCITDAAKDLQIRPKELFVWLNNNRWIYRRTPKGSWIAYQDKVMHGLLEHKITVIKHVGSTEKTLDQVRITSKGLSKIAESFANNEQNISAREAMNNAAELWGRIGKNLSCLRL